MCCTYFFSKSGICLFIFKVSFDRQKFLVSMKSNLLVSFSFMISALWILRNLCLLRRKQRYSPMFSSNSTIILALYKKVKLLLDVWDISNSFLCRVWGRGQDLFFPHTVIQLFGTLLKRHPSYSPPPLNHLVLVSETMLISMGTFLDILISSVSLFQKSACGPNPTNCLLL